MKKFIKSIPVYLTVVMLLCSMLVVPAFAFSYLDVIEPWNMQNDHFSIEDGYLGACEGAYTYTYSLPVGTYQFTYNMTGDFTVKGGDFSRDWVLLEMNPDTSEFELLPFSSDGVFTITEDMLYPDSDDPDFGNRCCVVVNSYLEKPVVAVYREPADGISNKGVYYQAFDMFADFFYGDGAELTGEQNMVLTILATTAVLFVVVVPFLIVFFVLRLFR